MSLPESIHSVVDGAHVGLQATLGRNMDAQSVDAVVSHWSTLIENFQASPLAFYAAVEAAMERRQIPERHNSRVEFQESGQLSASREYLRVTREKLVFDICAAPFGTGFFVSYWLVEKQPYLNPFVKVFGLLGILGFAVWMLQAFGIVNGLVTAVIAVFLALTLAKAGAAEGIVDDNAIQALPGIGALYTSLFKRETYYRRDTMAMFQKSVHNAVLEVVDAMTAEKGMRALAESERKPVMREFYAKAK